MIDKFRLLSKQQKVALITTLAITLITAIIIFAPKDTSLNEPDPTGTIQPRPQPATPTPNPTHNPTDPIPATAPPIPEPEATLPAPPHQPPGDTSTFTPAQIEEAQQFASDAIENYYALFSYESAEERIFRLQKYVPAGSPLAYTTPLGTLSSYYDVADDQTWTTTLIGVVQTENPIGISDTSYQTIFSMRTQLQQLASVHATPNPDSSSAEEGSMLDGPLLLNSNETVTVTISWVDGRWWLTGVHVMGEEG